MMITVIYYDGLVEVVPASVLSRLIELKQIVAFERAEGWVSIGEDPIRQKLQPYRGPAKRGYDMYLSRR